MYIYIMCNIYTCFHSFEHYFYFFFWKKWFRPIWNIKCLLHSYTLYLHTHLSVLSIPYLRSEPLSKQITFCYCYFIANWLCQSSLNMPFDRSIRHSLNLIKFITLGTYVLWMGSPFSLDNHVIRCYRKTHLETFRI